MPHITTVLYPAGVKFDMEYYLATHMPLVQKLWGPHGLKSWRVANYTSPDAPYAVQAWLEWEDAERSDKGIAHADSAAIFDDVPKFSDKKPIFVVGPQTGIASW